MTNRRWLVVSAGVVAILLMVGRFAAAAYTDFLWYDSLGAVALWRMRLATVLGLRAATALCAAGFAFLNLYTVRQSVVSLVFPRRVGNLEIGEEVPRRYLLGATIAVSAMLGGALAIPQLDWRTVVLARAARPFGESDPYIGADLGFFMYWLPFESAVWTWALFCVLAVSVAVIVLYALTPSLKWQRGALYASTYVRRHCTVLVGVILLMLAWGFRLDMYSTLMDGSGPDGAFGWVDHHVGVPSDLLLSLATLGAGLIVLWAGFAGQFRLAGIAVLTVLALSIAAREVAPLIAQHQGNEADRVARERPYQATRAGYTRRAFAFDAVPLADSSAAYASLGEARPWVPIWDPGALTRAIEGGRASDDAGLRVGWQWSPAGLVANVVEPPPPGASSRAPWTVVRVLAADADERGAPTRVRGPRAAGADETPIEAPLAYPGAVTPLIIADSLIHSAGIPLDQVVTRIAGAWALQDFRLIAGDLPQPRPTLIAHRDVRDRIARLMPFFAQGRNVEPLLLGDSLYWGVDLYAASSTYPLSRRVALDGEERSYLHHAAVAVVHGSTGDVGIVPDSVLDPVAATWLRRLPSMFSTWTALPNGLRALLPPAIDGLHAQAATFGRFGSRADPEPPRHVPTVDGADTSFYNVDLPLVLPGGRTTAITVPLVDDMDRLRGLVIGTGGSDRRTFWYPMSTPGPRWPSVIDRLRSVDSAGSAAREGPLAHGRIRAVPLQQGVGFVQPTYRWRPPSAPTLSRIGLLSGDSTRSVPPGAVGSTGPDADAPPPPGRQPNESASSLYAAMRSALRRGDWPAFGKAFEALGRALAHPPAR